MLLFSDITIGLFTSIICDIVHANFSISASRLTVTIEKGCVSLKYIGSQLRMSKVLSFSRNSRCTCLSFLCYTHAISPSSSAKLISSMTLSIRAFRNFSIFGIRSFFFIRSSTVFFVWSSKSVSISTTSKLSSLKRFWNK